MTSPSKEPSFFVSTAASRAAKAKQRQRRLHVAKKSWTIRFAVLVPIATAALATAQDLLPGMREYLSPWTYAAASIGISAIVAGLRLRQEANDE